jgi:hypothetical protein
MLRSFSKSPSFWAYRNKLRITQIIWGVEVSPINAWREEITATGSSEND